MERLLAKMDTDKEQMLSEMKTNQEMTARMDAKIGSMKAELKSAIEDLKTFGEETMACQEKTEARLQEEAASQDMTPEVAHEEIPGEDTVDMPGGEPRKRRRDRRHLAAVRRQKKEQDQNLDARRRRKEQKRAQKKDGSRRNLVVARRGTTRRVQVARRNFSSTKDTIWEYCESRKDLAATGREETRRAKVSRHKRNFVGRNRRKEIATGRNHVKDKIERGSRRLRAFRKRGTADVPLGILRDTEIQSWTLWRGRPPPKRKK
jgi:hypothetical protein